MSVPHDTSHRVQDAPLREDPAHPEDNEQYEDEDEDAPVPSLPRTPSSPPLVDVDVPQSELDLTMTFESILAESSGASASNPEVEIVQKRASNVLKLTQENEKLQAELRAMTERLEAAERRQQQLRQKAAGRPKDGNATSASTAT